VSNSNLKVSVDIDSKNASILRVLYKYVDIDEVIGAVLLSVNKHLFITILLNTQSSMAPRSERSACDRGS
jgi:hypothetical protein